MSDRIEEAHAGWLAKARADHQEAAKFAQDAAQVAEARRLEVVRLEAVIDFYAQLVAGGPETQAFPAVPEPGASSPGAWLPPVPAPQDGPVGRPMNPENLVAAACGNCGQQISRNMPGDRWRHQDSCVECPIPGGTSAEPYVPAPPVDAAGAHQLPAETTVVDPAETPKGGA